jgi:hypothetical protein
MSAQTFTIIDFDTLNNVRANIQNRIYERSFVVGDGNDEDRLLSLESYVDIIHQCIGSKNNDNLWKMLSAAGEEEATSSTVPTSQNRAPDDMETEEEKLMTVNAIRAMVDRTFQRFIDEFPKRRERGWGPVDHELYDWAVSIQDCFEHVMARPFSCVSPNGDKALFVLSDECIEIAQNIIRKSTSSPPFFYTLKEDFYAMLKERAILCDELIARGGSFTPPCKGTKYLIPIDGLVESVEAVFKRMFADAVQQDIETNDAIERMSYRDMDDIRAGVDKRTSVYVACPVCNVITRKLAPDSVRVEWRYGSTHYICSKVCLRFYLSIDFATNEPAREGLYGELVPDFKRPGTMMIVKKMPWEK